MEKPSIIIYQDNTSISILIPQSTALPCHNKVLHSQEKATQILYQSTLRTRATAYQLPQSRLPQLPTLLFRHRSVKKPHPPPLRISTTSGVTTSSARDRTDFRRIPTWTRASVDDNPKDPSQSNPTQANREPSTIPRPHLSTNESRPPRPHRPHL